MNYLSMPVLPELAEMGVKAVACFVTGYSEEKELLTIEFAVQTEHELAAKVIRDIWKLAAQHYDGVVVELARKVLAHTRLEEATVHINVGAYTIEEGE